MAGGTKRYEIQLVINTQQLQQAGQVANQVQQQVNQGAQQAAAGIQGMVDRVTRYVLGMQGIRMAWHAAMQAADEYREHLTRIDQQQKEMAQRGLTKQQRLGEYGYLLGVPNDQGLRRKVDAFGARTGLSETGQIEFLTALESSGGQYRGVGQGYTIAPEEFNKYQEMTGKRAAQSHIAPGPLAELAAGLLSNTDWNKRAADHPERGTASGQAFEQFSEITKILVSGRGKNARLFEEMVKSLTMQVKINREEGTLKGEDAPVKLAALMSTVAEMNPQEAGTYLSRGIEGVRLDKKKARPWARKIGFSLEDEPDVAINKIGQWYDAHPEAHRKGEVFADFLRDQMGMEYRRAKAADAIYSGMKKGVFANRMKIADQITPESAVAELDAATTGNVTMEAAKSEQELESTEFAQGDVTQRLKVMRNRAADIMKKRYDWGGSYDPRGFMRQFGRGAVNLGLGMMGRPGIDDAAEIDASLIASLADKVEMMPITRGEMTNFNLSDPNWRTRKLNELAPKYEQMTGKRVEDLLKEISDKLSEANQNQQGGNVDHAPAPTLLRH